MLEAIPLRHRAFTRVHSPSKTGVNALNDTPCAGMSGGDAAKDEPIIRKHAETSGFPATKITEAKRVIDPTTAAARNLELRVVCGQPGVSAWQPTRRSMAA
jgi:hypothetical protein